MLEKMKAAFSRLGVLAANYMPAGFKDCMLDLASQSDKHEEAIAALTQRLGMLEALANTND